jgi:beta-glucosidase
MPGPSLNPAFLWGAATSSHQIDGQNRFNDWWAWEQKGAVDGGVRSGLATDHLTRFREDLKLAREMGLTSYRFSFEWSRLEAKEGTWDSSAFDWYRELLRECELNGLTPMATLHHFTNPTWLAERGGFTNDNAPHLFARYVAKVAEAFGRVIPLWCTVNEPIVLAVGSHLGRFMPPGDFNPTAASRMCRNLLKAHVLAYDLLRRECATRTGPWRARPLEVGFAHNMLDFHPERPWHPLELSVTRGLSYFYNEAWLAAVNGERQWLGVPGVMPFADQLLEARNRRTFDFIGVNYYTKCYVRWGPRVLSEGSSADLPLGLTFAKRSEEATDLDWAIHPSGLRRVLMKTKRFNAPIYITENGLADQEDQRRGKFLLAHLHEVARARAEGFDIKGYYHWSLLDNFEWIKGYWPRFGLTEVNYDTLERTPRPSSRLYKGIIEAHEGSMAPQEKILAAFDPANDPSVLRP